MKKKTAAPKAAAKKKPPTAEDKAVITETAELAAYRLRCADMYQGYIDKMVKRGTDKHKGYTVAQCEAKIANYKDLAK